jgi:agmatinase
MVNLENNPDRAIQGGDLRGMGNEMPYSGALSLFRRNYSKNLDGADIAVSGVTYDLATANRPGTRFGPRGIREASTNLAWEGAPWPWGFDPFKTLAVVDCGDCAFDSGYPDQVPAAIEKHADDILATGTAMVTMGGDHFVTYPLLKAHHKIHGPMSLVHFDAHCDTWREDHERIDHGTMFYHAARHGLIDPAKSVQIGLRTLNTETHGFNILDADWVHENGPKAVAKRVCEIVGDNKAYLTFDIDCLDPAFAPGTGRRSAAASAPGRPRRLSAGSRPSILSAWTWSRWRRPTMWAMSRLSPPRRCCSTFSASWRHAGHE